MITTRFDEALIEEWGSKISQCDGEPEHDDGETDEPFPDIYLVGTYQFESKHEQEKRYQECRNAEAVIYPEECQTGTNRAGMVRKFTIQIGHVLFCNLFNDTLVCVSRKEE